jgi:SAM-dependent methyltransferase
VQDDGERRQQDGDRRAGPNAWMRRMFAANSHLQDYSLADVVNLLKAASLAGKVNASIDELQFRRLIARHGTPDYRYAKYFKKRTWLRAKMMRALETGVDKAPPGAVLDLGCGAGYFLYVCKYFGHAVHGIDLPGDPFFDDMMRFFGIARTDLDIRPCRPLPRLDTRFDLIAAHQICFNGHASTAPWGVTEWDFLLTDLCTNHLKPGGTIALEFNPEPSSAFYGEELRTWFAAQGAQIFRGRVIIRDVAHSRPSNPSGSTPAPAGS